jgi:hypothetical protein
MILEIAGGVFLGGCLLWGFFIGLPDLFRQLRITLDERRERKDVRERFKRAELQGFEYDRDSIYPALEQLGKWEKEQRERMLLEAS